MTNGSRNRNMSEKDAIRMLDRIRDEDFDQWTQEAWDAFGAAIKALENQKKAKKLRKTFLGFLCGACFVTGLFFLAGVEGGSVTNGVLALLFMAIGAVVGNVCHE